MKLKLTLRIWILILVLAFSLISIFGLPPKFFQTGVTITGVEPNSTAFEQGLRVGQVIVGIDGRPIETIGDFTTIIQEKFPSEESIKTTFTTQSSEAILFTKQAPEITVAAIPKTNIKSGLDLAGGSRALVRAQDQELSLEEMNDLIGVIENRLNVYGIADLKIRPVSDLDGNYFMLIEIAGATPSDLKDLISQQGEFVAKIGNETVFVGGEKDISSVCRNDATCARIKSCNPSTEGYFCNFEFTIFLSESAAQKHFDLIQDLEVNKTQQGNYLSKKLELYLDGNLVDSLLISENLKESITTRVSISGSGSGGTREDAFNDAKESMNTLQTILITGSLPYKLEIVKLDTISPIFGKEFIRLIFLAGAAALLVVAIVIFVRYRKLKSSIALLITSASEVIIILGIASFISWNLDLASIAGILATIGTGIDQQIIILDEAKQKTILSIKQKLKRAFAIILGAYFTSLVALLPLMLAGAGLLRGFAITTLIGITSGVLITRPAFTDMVGWIEG